MPISSAALCVLFTTSSVPVPVNFIYPTQVPSRKCHRKRRAKEMGTAEAEVNRAKLDSDEKRGFQSVFKMLMIPFNLLYSVLSPRDKSRSHVDTDRPVQVPVPGEGAETAQIRVPETE